MEAVPFSDSGEEPTDIIIWSAQQDSAFASEIMTHLAIYRRIHKITIKNFLQDLAAGVSPARGITTLVRARMRIVLVSSDFINGLMEDPLMIAASDAVVACRDRMCANKQDYRIIPVIIRPVGREIYERDPLVGKIVCLPRDKPPVQAWKHRDGAWSHVAGEIRQVLKDQGRL